jgi:hypothetical protein
MLEWSATGHDTRIVDGVDSYLIEDGRIGSPRVLGVKWRPEGPRWARV